MGWNDHISDNYSSETEQCPKCGKRFICITEEQVPGFRERDEKICPYCGEELCSSMEYEYTCRKIEGE